MLSRYSPPTNHAPTADATGGKAWQAEFARAKSLVANMTLAEKVNITSGISGRCVGNLGGVASLGIPTFCLEDGPAGVRPVHGVSQFPAGLTTAATWDRELIYNRSYAMGAEFYDQGVNIALAPVTGGPLGPGRNWEGWFADAYATGVASYASIQGLQDAGVMATAKHFIAYEQETYRNQYNQTEWYSVFPANEQDSISSNLDDKTTHEIYLWSFAEAVRAGAYHFMCSYNRINLTQSCNNAYTLNHLLKTELNFQGSVISDWGGQHDNVDSALGGLDMAMPGSGWNHVWGAFWGENLVELVENGTIPEYRLDDAAIRILTTYFVSGQDVNPPPEVIFNAVGDTYYDAPNGYRDVRKPETAKLIRGIGAQGITLLKNTGVLPLQNPGRIAVVGTDAMDNEVGPDGCGTDSNECPAGNINGTLSIGGGSGYAYAPYVVTPLDALKLKAYETGAEIGQVLKDGNATSSLADLLTRSDVTIVFVQAYSTEGRDRANISLDHSADELIAAAVNQSDNVVVVMHVPGVVDVEAWADNDNVTAILAAWLPGQESGYALVDVLYGHVNPSGKLPFTWAHSYSDYYPGTIVADRVRVPQSNFTEGVFVDYRWFDSQNITPRYEFGYGLSYTTFEYSDIQLDTTIQSDSSAVQETAEPFEDYDGSNSLYDVLFTVSATITNTGNYTGSEVAQLYVSIPEDDEPPRVLRGFDKVKDIEPGCSATATFPIRRKDVSSWSVERGLWYVADGDFTISVGASSRNLPLNVTWSSSSSTANRRRAAFFYPWL
ncbi:beta-D-xylosidase/beta-D-glucosidase [Fistulina hepatica ATCC 64428]|uniref:Probable beta-glucosidase G n=1 Tax=Fistulina hepatica ATCC 64428 TaxID=1128425 RepID=A0A0D7AAT9_9AGAR|nr:beta-D-xylosidase/beta-D-glucosidase [Fistulina hepatica ATCC 64428]